MNTSKFSSTHRFLHWGIALGMLILLLTGFLRMEWMGKKAVIAALEAQNFELTRDQMIAVYKSLRAPMWEWHVYAAYVVMALFVGRLIYMFTQGIRFPNPFVAKTTTKEKLQGWAYILFYVYLLIATITGVYLRWIEGGIKHEMEAVHKWGLYIVPIFLILHFVGIYFGERGTKKGVVSKMIGGE